MRIIILSILLLLSGCIRHYDQELTKKKRTSVNEEKKSILNLTPNLMVSDVNNSIEFYKNIVGFDVVTTIPDTGSFDFAILAKDDFEIMLQKSDKLQEDIEYFKNMSIGGSFTLYIEVKDILVIYERAIMKAEIIRELHQTYYATKEFSIKDNNGYILTFAEKLK